METTTYGKFLEDTLSAMLILSKPTADAELRPRL